jgi:phosphate transport system protein
MRDAYHDELDGLTSSLVDLASRVAGAIGRATHALLEADLTLAEQVIAGDADIDAATVDVETRAFDLLARQQPVAGDLRTIVTSLRIVSDLERAGDYAHHVAAVARRRYPAHAVPAELSGTVVEMGQLAQRILTKTGSALASRSMRLAAEVERDDDLVDALHQRLFGVLLAEGWRGGVEAAIDVVLCGRYYERCADHAVSVARRVPFLVTGAFAPSP